LFSFISAAMMMLNDGWQGTGGIRCKCGILDYMEVSRLKRLRQTSRDTN